ncbi:MAG: hypothetical protein MHM6MM_006111 [Cercozoa sp. M6MM]
MSEASEELGYEITYEGSEEPQEYADRDGACTVKYPNGDTFVGELVDGRKHCEKAVYEWTEQHAKYEGPYVNGVRTGRGKMFYPDGSVYTGDFKDNWRHGNGVYKFANGDVYEGTFFENERHGAGTYVMVQNGDQLCGEWDRGVFLKGKWVLSDGSFWTSAKYSAASRPSGDGAFKLADGTVVSGHFDADTGTFYAGGKLPSDEKPSDEDQDDE